MNRLSAVALLVVSILASAGFSASADTEVAPSQCKPACLGTTELPAALSGQFVAVQDCALLAKAIGQPNAGSLCQGQVYESKGDSRVALFRAWNSTNPGSKLGNWWAFDKPEGRVADYRMGFEICYQWSPLDMLVRCTLKPGTKVVVGTGQSAQCSQYLSYPVSDRQQVYIENAGESVVDCATQDGVFAWQ